MGVAFKGRNQPAKNNREDDTQQEPELSELLLRSER
jgi:hypothetical protein